MRELTRQVRRRGRKLVEVDGQPRTPRSQTLGTLGLALGDALQIALGIALLVAPGASFLPHCADS